MSDGVGLYSVEPVSVMHIAVLIAGKMAAEIQLVLLLNVLLGDISVGRIEDVGVVLDSVEWKLVILFSSLSYFLQFRQQ